MADLVVLNYNDAETVLKFVENIINYKTINHIIVVDNASSDNSYLKLKETLNSNKVHVIQTKGNGGYAKGNNYGIRYAIKNFKSKYIIISNPDVKFDENIVPILESKLHSKDIASVTGKMICTSSVKLPMAWKLPSFKDCVLENLIILSKLIRNKSDYALNQVDDEGICVEAIPGSFFMIDVDKVMEVGFFDENTFLYYEENILGYKLKEKGYKQFLLPNCSYIHNHSVSINKSIKSVSKRLKHAYDSREYYCLQYLKINKLEQLILHCTFYIGRVNFIFVKQVIKFFKGITRP